MLTIDELSRTLSLHPRKVLAAAIGSQVMIAELVDRGTLIPAGTVVRRLCDRCDQQHLAEVVSTPYGQGWYCPADGFIVADPIDIAAYAVGINTFVSEMEGLVDRRRRWAKPRGAPILWSIGSFMFKDLQVAIYFGVNVGAPHIFSEVIPLLRDEPRPDALAVLTNDTQNLDNLILPSAGRTVPIVDCLTTSESGQLRLDRECLVRRVVPEHLLRSRKAGRPKEAEGRAAELILELDRNGALRAMGQNERHRVLLAAARRKYGPRGLIVEDTMQQCLVSLLRDARRRLSRETAH